MSKGQPVCLVLGAGAGIGGTVGKKFADNGYHAVLCRRSDKDGLDRLVGAIEDDGGKATGMLVNATEDGAIENLVATVEKDIGPIEVVLFNLGAQIGDRGLMDTPQKTFTLCWQMACFGLFRLAQAVVPLMVERGSGKILVTSATAAKRGNPGQHAHAAAMGGRRMLCQTLNAEFAPQGVHICHILVDGAVEAPDTLGKILGQERYAQMLAKYSDGKDGMLIPAEMAETYYHVAHQHRSAWTHELDLRSFSTRPWWNSASGMPSSNAQ